jgi:catechol 2,3-dioxygenase-like lactoylglutathione lyase family enzyme
VHSKIESLVDQFEEKRLTRRELVASLVSLVGCAGAAPVSSAQSESEAAAHGRSLNHVSLAVADVARAADFYQGLLGLEPVSRPGNGGINLGLGAGFLGLYKIPNPGRAHHFCIGVEDYDPERIAERLRQRGMEPTIDRNPNNRTSGGDQLYFSDPDGTLVQLSGRDYKG